MFLHHLVQSASKQHVFTETDFLQQILRRVFVWPNEKWNLHGVWQAWWVTMFGGVWQQDWIMNCGQPLRTC